MEIEMRTVPRALTHSADTPRPPSGLRRWVRKHALAIRISVLTLALLAAGFAWAAKGSGLLTRVARMAYPVPPPKIDGAVAISKPIDGEFDVSVTTPITATLRFRNSSLDERTVSDANVMLIRTADQSKVAATVATSDDTIALRLRDPLEPCTSYTFCVNE